MRQFLTGVLAVVMAAGAAGLFALGFFLLSALLLVRPLLERLEDLRSRIRGH